VVSFESILRTPFSFSFSFSCRCKGSCLSSRGNQHTVLFGFVPSYHCCSRFLKRPGAMSTRIPIAKVSPISDDNEYNAAMYLGFGFVFGDNEPRDNGGAESVKSMDTFPLYRTVRCRNKNHSERVGFLSVVTNRNTDYTLLVKFNEVAPFSITKVPKSRTYTANG